MKDMMALAAERAAKVLGKVLPDTDKSDKRDNDDEEGSHAALGKKERHRD